MEQQDFHPEDRSLMRRYLNRQARWLPVVCAFKRIGFDGLLESVGIDQCDYRRWRAGRAAPTREQMFRIHRLLGLSPEVLYDLAADDTTELEYRMWAESLGINSC